MKTKISILFLIIFYSVNSLNAQTDNYLLSKISYQKKDYPKSLEYINAYLNQYPNSENAILLNINILFQIKDYNKAIDNILKISRNNDYYLMLARAFSGINNTSKAVENMDLYLKTRNKKSEAEIKSFKEFDILFKNEAWVNLWKKDWYQKKEKILNDAEYAYSLKNYDEAENIINELLDKYNKSYKAFYIRGLINFNKKNLKQALSDFESAINLNKKDINLNLDYALCLVELNKTKKAFEIYEDILKNDSTELKAFYGRAKLGLATNNLANAQSDIEYYLQYYPDNEDVNYLAAQIDFKAGDFLSAIPKFGKLIKINPAKEEYFIGRANCYMKTETYKYAIFDYSMALDLNPKLSEVYYQKANAHYKIGQIEQACANWNYSYRYGNTECTKLIYKHCK
ncbi:MAG: tetratricopeptide repeat protein [Bacteroidales bacterium]|nr:tetratricopeptide repeat protein [Bacteroidales bacterium]MBN2756811.1 tetratricopeptide repeat protein [Bacteroidales bacterium]